MEDILTMIICRVDRKKLKCNFPENTLQLLKSVSSA